MPPASVRIVHVLLPTGTRSEADAVRKAFGDVRGLQLIMGTGFAHTSGQDLVGDVVVIGAKPPKIEKDASGRVYHAKDLLHLKKVVGEVLGRREAVEVELAEEKAEPDHYDEHLDDDLEHLSNEELRTRAMALGVELPTGYVKNDELKKMIRGTKD